MGIERHAAAIVATMARMAADGPTDPIPAAVLAAAIRYASDHHTYFLNLGDYDLRRIAEDVARRVPYHPE